MLILIAELLFNAEVFAQFNLYIIAGLILIPVVISPWESLNSQLHHVNETFDRRWNRIDSASVLLAFLVIVTLLVLAYGISRRDIDAHMARLRDVNLHGANHFCLRAHHGCFLEHAAHQQMADHPGQKEPHDPDKNGFIGRIFSFLLLFLLTMPITALMAS